MKSIIAASLFFSANCIQAESYELDVYAAQSARLSGSGFYCCSPDSMNLEPASIAMKNCSVQGGYCMVNRYMSAWIFDIPALEGEPSLVTIRLQGSSSGTGGPGILYYKWLGEESMDLDTVIDAYSNPEFTQNTYWYSSSSFNLNLTSAAFSDPDMGRLMVVGYKSGTSSLTLTNEGSSAVHLNLMIETPETPCPGDYDDDGVVSVDDVLALLARFGLPSASHDLDGDGLITVNDILMLIDHYGVCPE